MSVESRADAGKGLTRRFQATTRVLLANDSTTGQRLAAGGTAVAAIGVAGTAVGEAISEVASLAQHHPQFMHALAASPFPTTVEFSGGIGAYIFISTGAGMVTKRRAHDPHWTQADYAAVGRRLSVTSRFCATAAAITGGSALAGVAIEHAAAVHAGAALLQADGVVGTAAAMLAITSAIGSKLARGPQPTPPRALGER